MAVEAAEASTSQAACEQQGPVTRRQKRLAEDGSDCLAVAPRKVLLGLRTKRSRSSQTSLSLFVRWYNPSGKTKVSQLVLKRIDTVDALQAFVFPPVKHAFQRHAATQTPSQHADVQCQTVPFSAVWLQGRSNLGMSKNLVDKAFPATERPDYLTGPDFYKFTPAEEFMSLPGDIARTEFRLVVTHEGWEYCILERELGAHLESHRDMLVTVIEFESTALMIGQVGLRVNLIAYPVISIKKSFLDGMEHELKTNPQFKGQLGSGAAQ